MPWNVCAASRREMIASCEYQKFLFGFVFSTAFRLVNLDVQLAEDVTQTVL